MHDGGFGKRVCADKFVVRRMKGHADDTDFAGYSFGAPREVAAFEAEAAVLSIPTTGADEMDTLGADSGVGWLAALLEGSVCLRSEWHHNQDLRSVPLLAVVCSLCSGS